MPSPDGERSAATASLQWWLKAALTERLGYKAAALFFAVVLWLVVSAEEPSEEVVPVKLEASFDTARVLTSTRPELRALVAGRARDLIKLYEKPPVVRRAVTDDAPDSVAVDLKPADVYIPPDVDAVVRDIQPRTLVLVFDVTSSRRVPVANKVRVEVADRRAGMTAERLTRIVPDSVTITGPRRVVNTVRFVATVDQTVTVRDTGDFMIPLDVKRLAAGVHVQPAEVRLFVQLPPVTRGSRDSALITAFRTK
jgi:YbbR domain-containing protein